MYYFSNIPMYNSIGQDIGSDKDGSDQEQQDVANDTQNPVPTQSRSVGVQTIKRHHHRSTAHYHCLGKTFSSTCWKQTLVRELGLCQANLIQMRPHVLKVLDEYDASAYNSIFSQPDTDYAGCSEPPEAVEELWEVWRQAEALLALVKIELSSFRDSGAGDHNNKPVYRCFTNIQEHAEYASQLARYISTGRPVPILSALCKIEGLTFNTAAVATNGLTKPINFAKCSDGTSSTTTTSQGSSLEESSDSSQDSQLRIILNPETLSRLILVTDALVDTASDLTEKIGAEH